MFPLSAVVCALVAAAVATNVQQCPGRSFENLSNDVQLEPCKKLPCKLKRGTNEFITVKFTPDKEIKDLTNEVNAQVLGVPVPFIGVDGNSVCGKLFTEAGEKASCPLSAGTTYLYKDQFPVMQIYPPISTQVHWALKFDGKEVSCFEVPVRII